MLIIPQSIKTQEIYGHENHAKIERRIKHWRSMITVFSLTLFKVYFHLSLSYLKCHLGFCSYSKLVNPLFEILFVAYLVYILLFFITNKIPGLFGAFIFWGFLWGSQRLYSTSLVHWLQIVRKFLLS